VHEVSLLENILDTLQSYAQSQHFTKVIQIELEIGALSGVSADALQFGFDAVMKGSLAEQATLTIHPISGVGKCRVCNTYSQLTTLHDPCHHCGAFGMMVTKGTQMRIKALKVI
jgi:hydrogenase nickel incorporation protein HypA/HybF